MDKPVIIFGATGLGRVALDIFTSHNVVVYGLLDDDEARHGEEIDTVPVLGATDNDGFLKLIGRKCEAFVASDELAYRKRLVEMLRERRKVMPVNAVHRTARLAASARLGHGNLVAAGVQLGPNADVGHHCLLRAGALVEHDAQVGNYVQLGAGVVVGAGAALAEDVFVGTGATVVPGVTIGAGARVGAGSVVVADVPADATVFGNPAQPVKR